LDRGPNKEYDLRELISVAASFLGQSCIEEPYKNAELILSHVLKESQVNLYLYDKKFISSKELQLFRTLVSKRAESIPLQYLTKKVFFYGYEFNISRGVFIPRPETEMLVEEAINISRKYFLPGFTSILDIGTGSGNISIVVAKEIEKSSVTAVDISAKALNTALVNAKMHGVEDRIKFLKCSLFPGPGKKFHMIISNPPYICDSAMASLPAEVRKEPVKALAGGTEGLDLVKRIIEKSDRFLFEKGCLLLEIGYGQAEFLNKIPSNLKLMYIKRDLSGIERYAVFQKDD